MNKITRRSFLKIAGVTALAATGMIALSGCEGETVQVLLPLRFEWAGPNAEEWAPIMKELDQAPLVTVPLQDEEKLSAAVLAVVSAEIKAHPDKYNNLNPAQLVVEAVEPTVSYLDGTETKELLVTMNLGKLPR